MTSHLTDARLAASEPIDDPVHRAVLAARDEELMARLIDAEWRRAGVEAEGLRARVVLAHYRPRARARLMVRVEVPRPGKKRPRVQVLYLQIYATRAAARRRLAHATRPPLRCLGPAVFLIEELAAVAWALPNGPMLRTTRMLLRRRKFSRFLVEAGFPQPEGRGPRPPELIRYVPRRRATFRHGKPDPQRPGAIYVKVYAPGQDEVAASNLALARVAAQQSGAFQVPELLAHVAKRRALVMGELAGRSLTDVAALPEAGAAFRAVGRALAALHGSGIRPAARWTVESEVAALRAATADLGRALPALQPLLEEVVTEIARRAGTLTCPEAPIHGNLFADQVLIGDELSVGIVDWDDACMGDPLFDVGRLAAHVLFLKQRGAVAANADPVRELVGAYEDAGAAVDDDRLRWHVATALLLRAKISALRALPDGWVGDVERSLAAADAILAGRGLLRGVRS